MPFEIFTREPISRGRSSEPTIRLYPDKRRITISKAAIELLPKSCTHVVLAFETETRQIALIAAASTDPKGVRITRGTSSQQLAVGGFLEHHSMQAGTYPVSDQRLQDRGALVSVEVPKAEPEATS